MRTEYDEEKADKDDVMVTHGSQIIMSAHTTKKGTESQSSPGGTDECIDLETLTTTARWMLAATVQAELQRRRLKIFSPDSGRFRGFFSGTRQCTAVSQ